jgi:hypothetical protein
MTSGSDRSAQSLTEMFTPANNDHPVRLAGHQRFNRSGSLATVPPCQRPPRGVATFRFQFVSDLLDGQMTKLNQDRLQRLCISIRFALVLLRLLGIAELDAARLGSRERLLGSV